MLPAFLASDQGRAERFKRGTDPRDAESPHIGAIYALEESDGILGLVLELVEGPTLADRLKRDPCRSDALAMARQTADVLKRHTPAIIHRDLKPANIKGRPNGTKVLDFGLAKASRTDGREPDWTSDR
jgi:serine/threonine protein kinase